jgi:hypothetical protein
MPTRVTRISATASLLLALTAGVGLVLWPCAYQGIEVQAQPAPAGAVQRHQLCATLIQANGVDVLFVLALPVLLAGVGLFAVRAGRRGILAAVMVALVVFCLLAIASVGLLYLPAAAALVIAVVGWRQQPSAPTNG